MIGPRGIRLSYWLVHIVLGVGLLSLVVTLAWVARRTLIGMNLGTEASATIVAALIGLLPAILSLIPRCRRSLIAVWHFYRLLVLGVTYIGLTLVSFMARHAHRVGTVWLIAGCLLVGIALLSDGSQDSRIAIHGSIMDAARFLNEQPLSLTAAPEARVLLDRFNAVGSDVGRWYPALDDLRDALNKLYPATPLSNDEDFLLQQRQVRDQFTKTKQSPRVIDGWLMQFLVARLKLSLSKQGREMSEVVEALALLDELTIRPTLHDYDSTLGDKLVAMLQEMRDNYHALALEYCGTYYDAFANQAAHRIREGDIIDRRFSLFEDAHEIFNRLADEQSPTSPHGRARAINNDLDLLLWRLWLQAELPAGSDPSRDVITPEAFERGEVDVARLRERLAGSLKYSRSPVFMMTIAQASATLAHSVCSRLERRLEGIAAEPEEGKDSNSPAERPEPEDVLNMRNELEAHLNSAIFFLDMSLTCGLDRSYFSGEPHELRMCDLLNVRGVAMSARKDAKVAQAYDLASKQATSVLTHHGVTFSCDVCEWR